MTKHTFKPGERAYHVVRREIVVLKQFEFNKLTGDSIFHIMDDYGNLYRADGTQLDWQLLLPPSHPDVPERLREKKPKRKQTVHENILCCPRTKTVLSTIAGRTPEGVVNASLTYEIEVDDE